MAEDVGKHDGLSHPIADDRRWLAPLMNVGADRMTCVSLPGSPTAVTEILRRGTGSAVMTGRASIQGPSSTRHFGRHDRRGDRGFRRATTQADRDYARRLLRQRAPTTNG